MRVRARKLSKKSRGEQNGRRAAPLFGIKSKSSDKSWKNSGSWSKFRECDSVDRESSFLHNTQGWWPFRSVPTLPTTSVNRDRREKSLCGGGKISRFLFLISFSSPEIREELGWEGQGEPQEKKKPESSPRRRRKQKVPPSKWSSKCTSAECPEVRR